MAGIDSDFESCVKNKNTFQEQREYFSLLLFFFPLCGKMILL